MERERPIGVYDSGVGGLTVVKWLRRKLPKEQILYFGDTARVPYGGRPPEEIIKFSRQILAFFVEKDVKFVIAACNTSSALALPSLIPNAPVPLMGVIGPGVKKAAVEVKGRRIGVIGTKGTVESRAYTEALQNVDPDIQVWETACPRLVPLVENGEWEGRQIETLLTEYLQPLLKHNIDTLILGCTHYPYLMTAIRAVLGNDIQIVDPGEAAAEEAVLELDRLGLLTHSKQGSDGFYVSGDPHVFGTIAKRLGYKADLEVVDINRY
ncbi:MAG: glutamate racemase [Firmicutes bacterium]|nr:glutamate racemase [Bacillota bacterium]